MPSTPDPEHVDSCSTSPVSIPESRSLTSPSDTLSTNHADGNLGLLAAAIRSYPPDRFEISVQWRDMGRTAHLEAASPYDPETVDTIIEAIETRQVWFGLDGFGGYNRRHFIIQSWMIDHERDLYESVVRVQLTCELTVEMTDGGPDHDLSHTKDVTPDEFNPPSRARSRKGSGEAAPKSAHVADDPSGYTVMDLLQQSEWHRDRLASSLRQLPSNVHLPDGG